MGTDLFGVESDGSGYQGAGRRARGPKGGKHYVKPMGYAGIPGTGPAGKTCRDCEHYISTSHGRSARSWPKCLLREPQWTSGRGSDILARSPACNYFKEKTP